MLDTQLETHVQREKISLYTLLFYNKGLRTIEPGSSTALEMEVSYEIIAWF